MMEFKGTPGPWEKGGIIGRYVDGRHKWTHICTVQDDDIDSQEYEANINLIYAAPDLLVELVRLCELIEVFGFDPHAARAAIAKALGKEEEHPWANI